MLNSPIRTATLLGIRGVSIGVEVDLRHNVESSFGLAGLRSAVAWEAAERVATEIQRSGYRMPPRRVEVTLTPEAVPKTGEGVELAIAVAILAAGGDHGPLQGAMERTAFLGNLGAQGEITAVRGLRSLVEACRADGARTVVVPMANAAEASAIPGVDCLVAASLRDVMTWLQSRSGLSRAQDLGPGLHDPPAYPDMADVHGNERARRAVEISAAGGHSLLLVGPPGCGKTMLAARMPGILPPLTPSEQEDVTRVHSAGRLLPSETALLTRRPFRAPHSTTSVRGMTGSALRGPGDIACAHHGVLFLDEILEFPPEVRHLAEASVGPHGFLTARTGHGTVFFPADALLVGGMSPCPCGRTGHPKLLCGCSAVTLNRHRARAHTLRFQMTASVEHVARDLLGQRGCGETSAAIQQRVMKARRAQAARGRRNAYGTTEDWTQWAISDPVRARLAHAHGDPAMSAHAVLRIARTIADLAGVPEVGEDHVDEAITFACTPVDPDAL